MSKHKPMKHPMPKPKQKPKPKKWAAGRWFVVTLASALTTTGVTAMETGKMHALIARSGEYKTSNICSLVSCTQGNNCTN